MFGRPTERVAEKPLPANFTFSNCAIAMSSTESGRPRVEAFATPNALAFCRFDKAGSRFRFGCVRRYGSRSGNVGNSLIRGLLLFIFVASLILQGTVSCAADQRTAFRLARFSVDVTIPLGHRCMGILPTKSRVVADPLYAHGVVIVGADDPIVICAVDWCEIRNGAYDQWRDRLAAAAGTLRQRVLVSSVHQHDAPVVDREAAKLLEQVGLKGELYDEAFHERTLDRVADAVEAAMEETVPITHVGLGQARADQIASSRRVVTADEQVAFNRGSRSGDDPFHSEAPDGLIDPFLKTISFWNNETPLAALHAYATHPMSYYGEGEVSSDFVGLARQRMAEQYPMVQQVYFSGCSGDVTAGKYNDGSVKSRTELIDRLHRAMVQSWKDTVRHPLRHVSFRNAEIDLPFSPNEQLTEASLSELLHDRTQSVESRVWAAMGLSSRQRVAGGQKIDLPCVDLGPAQIVVFPGEAFVGYQLMAQNVRPESFVFSIGYGECWPGYIPTEESFGENFRDKWLWAGPGSEQRILSALYQVLASRESN